MGKPAFCLALYLSGVHFRDELQHVGDVSEQKFKCRPIRTREIHGVRLSEALYEKSVTKKIFALHIYYVNILFVFNRENFEKRSGLFKFGRTSRDYFFQIRKKAMAFS